MNPTPPRDLAAAVCVMVGHRLGSPWALLVPLQNGQSPLCCSSALLRPPKLALFLLPCLLLSCYAACCSFEQHLAYPLHGSATLSPRCMLKPGIHVLSSACIAQVYLPMSYVYGARGTGKLTPLVLSLRKELYGTSYDAVDWNAARNQCAPTDLYYPHPQDPGHPVVDAVQGRGPAAGVWSPQEGSR